jgi:hypothetical protein
MIRNPAEPVDDPPLTPLYDSLTTNLPHPIMAYPDFLFPPSTPLYPAASVVQKYLEDYARHFDLVRHIKLNTRVTLAARDSSSFSSSSSSNGTWSVTFQDAAGAHTDQFEHIVVSNGHYRQPRIPNVPGLSNWLKMGRASHAVYFRRPGPEHIGKTILVVGAGPSGSDISRDMRSVARVVVQSVTGGVAEDPEKDDYKKGGRVREYRDDGSVVFENGDVFTGIDHCILATGYNFSFPFLPWLKTDIPPVEAYASPTDVLSTEITNSGYHVFPLARHVFPLCEPSGHDLPPGSIAFIGHPWRVIPFPLHEAQARAFVHVLVHPEAFVPKLEAQRVVGRARDILERRQIRNAHPDAHPDAGASAAVAKAWHRFDGDEEQFDYRDELNAWAAPSAPGGRPSGSWVRELYPCKDVMRESWRELERMGVAEDWVRNVGVGRGHDEDGLEEWIELMWKVYRRQEPGGGKRTGTEPDLGTRNWDSHVPTHGMTGKL